FRVGPRERRAPSRLSPKLESRSQRKSEKLCFWEESRKRVRIWPSLFESLKSSWGIIGRTAISPRCCSPARTGFRAGAGVHDESIAKEQCACCMASIHPERKGRAVRRWPLLEAESHRVQSPPY